MQVFISSQHFEAGTALRHYVNDRTMEVVQKYFEDATSVHVHFTKQGFQFICNIVVHDGTGRHVIIKSDASSDEIYSSFDTALTKAEKQLRKYKSKLKDRHNRVKISEVTNNAIKYTINPFQSEQGDEFDIGDNPSIIAEKPIEVKKLSVGEAVMQMDLENLPALMFQNAKTGRINVVYYRRDGNISWIDSL